MHLDKMMMKWHTDVMQNLRTARKGKICSRFEPSRTIHGMVGCFAKGVGRAQRCGAETDLDTMLRSQSTMLYSLSVKGTLEAQGVFILPFIAR